MASNGVNQFGGGGREPRYRPEQSHVHRVTTSTRRSFRRDEMTPQPVGWSIFDDDLAAASRDGGGGDTVVRQGKRMVVSVGCDPNRLFKGSWSNHEEPLSTAALQVATLLRWRFT
jgi:hypothetical protein